MTRQILAALALPVLLGVGSAQLDSQYVLQRYASAIANVAVPKTMIYSYTVSQVGPNNIEQHHRLYRSGTDVRDETLTVDGMALRRKIVRFSHRQDRYTVARFAPHADAYEMLFLGTAKDGHHIDYVYETTPLNHPAGAWIERLTIDGINFLPRVVRFHTGGIDATGTGEIVFGPFGKYWMPVAALAVAHVKGKPARERITWSDYRFPQTLPASTFQAPQPLVHATPPSR
jgi:hypothetical protein